MGAVNVQGSLYLSEAFGLRAAVGECLNDLPAAKAIELLTLIFKLVYTSNAPGRAFSRVQN